MTFEEWIASLNMPPGVSATASEAFAAGQECLMADLKQLWRESGTMGEFAENVAGHIGEL